MSSRKHSDPVTLEVVRYGVVAAADDMAAVLCKTAYNMMIYEVHDFCCGLIDTQGQMISQNRGGLPIFLADLGVAIRDGIEKYGLDGFSPNDVLLMNHAGVCGQHLNNVAVYTPCFHRGRLVAFAANRAHWVDVGGSRVGFGSSQTTDIFQEGLQFRSIKLQAAGVSNEAVLQIIGDNVRFPDSVLGDLRAQIACCRLGEKRVAELADRYGWDTMTGCIEEIWDQAEAQTRAMVSRIPDGRYSAESCLDNDGRELDKPLRVKVTVEVRGSDMIMDFSEMNPQVAGPLNSGYSGGLAAARIAYKCLTLPEAPVNEGSFRALQLVLPEGTFLSARPPAAIGQWSVALPTVVDTTLKALASAIPERIPAAHKGDMGGYSIYGQDARGRRFMLLNMTSGGWGGHADGDGQDASVSICQGDVRNIPIEVQEAMYPVRIEHFKLRTDSGGAGKYRGGLGIDIRISCLVPCRVNVNLDRTKCPPWGLEGGLEGETNLGLIRRASGSEEVIYKGTNVPLAPGDSVTFRTAGGGGYGDPKKRERAQVAADMEEGLISEAAARGIYGAEVGPRGSVVGPG
jgi:N-methylhydantoinase B